MRQRIITGIIFGAIVLALLFINHQTRLIFIGALGILTLIEYSRMTQFKWSDYLISFIGIILFYFLIFQAYYGYIITIVNVVFLLALWLNMILKSPIYSYKILPSVPATWQITIPLLLIVAADWHQSNYILLIGVLLLTWVTDSAAYFIGSQIGKRKILARVSPGKTWEGFFGAGMIVLFGAFVISSFNVQFSFDFWIKVGLIVWICGLAGDLIISFIKRSQTIKDSGGMLPGHGGFLDRFDAFIFIVPFVELLRILS